MPDAEDPRLRPWRMTGTAMRPNVLLMCKLLFVMLVAHGFTGRIDDPFLPFWPPLDALRSPGGVWKWIVRAAFLGGGAALIVNVAVRAASATVGLAVIATVLGNMTLFHNHVMICGCLLLLAGLHHRGDTPWLLYAQVSVVYVGAFLSKITDPDWWDGRFMHTFLLTARHEPAYAMLADGPLGSGAALMLSWTAMVAELLVALAVAFPRTRAVGALLILGFHGMLFVLLRGERFGHFLENMLIALLIFVPWPSGDVEVRLGPRLRPWLAPLFATVDWDRRVRIRPRHDAGVAATLDGREWHGLAAVRRVLGCSTGFYVFLFAGWHLAVYGLHREHSHLLLTALGAGLVVLFAFPSRLAARIAEVSGLR